MSEKCPVCGDEMEEQVPNFAMGEKMYGRGVETYVCTNPRCERFMK